MRVASVQVGKPMRRGSMRTGFGKLPVSGPVRVGLTNLEGDGQAWAHHGGPEMAVMAYGADCYSLWREELGWPELPLGGFGENLSVEGADDATVCIGDVWRIGSAVLQVASPRKPCSKISRFWGRPDLLQRVVDSGRTGWYLRVLQVGQIEAGDQVELAERAHPDWTVLRAFRSACEKGPRAGRRRASRKRPRS